MSDLIHGAKFVKLSKGKPGFGIQQIDAAGCDTGTIIPYTHGLRKNERMTRRVFQKSMFDIAMDMRVDDVGSRIADPKLRNQVKLLAEETDQQDQFDGIYGAFQLLQPPVDPNVLVRISQSVPVMDPIIDSMCTNIDGFGQIYVQTLDLDDKDTWDDIKDHFRGKLLDKLEFDGVNRITKVCREKINFSETYHEENDSSEWDGLVTKTLLKAVATLGVKEVISETDSVIAKKAWRNGVGEAAKEIEISLEKIRDREFRGKLKRMKAEQRDEKRFLKNFFSNCNPKLSWMRIRKQFRDDKERIGAGAIEVARNKDTLMPEQLGHIPAVNVRMTRLGEYVQTRTPHRINEIEITDRPRMVRFRKFVQSLGRTGRYIWFKEFGDQRIMDKHTGRYVGEYVWNEESQEYERKFYDKGDLSNLITQDAFTSSQPSFEEANEIIYDARYNAIGSPYPVPRWFGSLTLCQGLIAMEEVNASWFDNSLIPPMIVKVSDGNLSKKSRDRIESMFERRRGREKHHGILVLEAESQARSKVFANTGRPTIEIESLRDVIESDSTHNKYDEIGRLKLRAHWRLPPSHVGQESQYTRQSINASKVAAEEQVFQPEREEFDDLMNKFLMPALRINYWYLKTNSPPVADSLQMAQVLSILGKAGFITVGEVRPEMEIILNRPLKKFTEENLSTTPFPLVLIETKFEIGQKEQDAKTKDQTVKGNPTVTKPNAKSDGSKSNSANPQDGVGGRPDKAGFITDSEVVKALFKSSIGIDVGSVFSVEFEKADDMVDELLDEHGSTFLRDEDGVLYFITKSASGQRTSFKHSVET